MANVRLDQLVREAAINSNANVRLDQLPREAMINSNANVRVDQVPREAYLNKVANARVCQVVREAWVTIGSNEVQLIGGAFQDAEGNPIAFGYMTMTLIRDYAGINSQIVSGVTITIKLDGMGNVSTSPNAQLVWPNDILQPAGSSYKVYVYSANGQLVYGPWYQTVLSTPNPFNVGVWIPQMLPFF